MINKYDGYNSNEKDFEDYMQFIYKIEDVYNMDTEDVMMLEKSGLFILRLTNFMKTLGIVFRENNQDYKNLLELADCIFTLSIYI